MLSPADVALGRLRKAAAEGDFVMVKALLDQGVAVSGVDPLDAQRDTALHAAAGPGHFPVAKLLFQRGASITAKNALGETPVDLARKNNHEAIVVLLGMRDADEAVPPPTAAAPVDPSQLDPGALIEKVGDILQNAQAAAEQPNPAAQAKVAAPAPAPAPEPAPAPVIVAPAPSAPAVAEAKKKDEATPAQLEKKEELCGQITSAMSGLSETDAIAALEEAGINRDVAMQQMQIVRTTCGQ